MALADRFAIIDALKSCGLDDEHAEAVVDHRRVTIRKPLTLRAAQLLAKEMAKCPDPNAAADEMIMNAWQGFRAEWIKPKPQGQPSLGYRQNFREAQAELNATLFAEEPYHGRDIDLIDYAYTAPSRH